MSEQVPAAQRHTEIALFRYTLILPLLRGEHPPGGKQDLRRHRTTKRGASTSAPMNPTRPPPQPTPASHQSAPYCQSQS